MFPHTNCCMWCPLLVLFLAQNAQTCNKEINKEEIRLKNEELLKTLKPGDLIKFYRDFYEDWAVHIGQEDGVYKVIHLQTGEGNDQNLGDCMACIKIYPFWEFTGTSKAENGNIMEKENGIDGDKVAEGAKALKDRTDKDEITDLFNNSEHFAKWCRYGLLAQIKSVEDIGKLKDLSAIILDPMTSNTNVAENITKHNIEVLKTLEEGDLIKFDRGHYYHWAVFIGKAEKIDNAVIHWWSPAGSIPSKKGTSITINSFWEAANGNRADKGNDSGDENRNIDGSAVVRRAKVRQRLVTEERIINEKYNVFFNNCEHFAKWCRYGSDESNKDEMSSSCRPQEDFHIAAPDTRAVLELMRKWESKALELEEEVKQLRIEINNLQRHIYMCYFIMFIMFLWKRR